MDYQKVFNRVVRHLNKQMKKSVVNGECLYRGPKGLKCAVGGLIPNKFHPEDYNNEPVVGLPIKILKAIGVKSQKDVYFLGNLQIIHDVMDPMEWRECLEAYAKTAGLKMPVWKSKAALKR